MALRRAKFRFSLPTPRLASFVRIGGRGPISCGRKMGRPKEERRSTGIDLGSLLNKKSEPKEALLFHQAFCVSSAAVKFDLNRWKSGDKAFPTRASSISWSARSVDCSAKTLTI